MSDDAYDIIPTENVSKNCEVTSGHVALLEPRDLETHETCDDKLAVVIQDADGETMAAVVDRPEWLEVRDG